GLRLALRTGLGLGLRLAPRTGLGFGLRLALRTGLSFGLRSVVVLGALAMFALVFVGLVLATVVRDRCRVRAIEVRARHVRPGEDGRDRQGDDGRERGPGTQGFK